MSEFDPKEFGLDLNLPAPDPAVEDALAFAASLRQDEEPLPDGQVALDTLFDKEVWEAAEAAAKKPPLWQRFSQRVFPMAGDSGREIGRKLLLLAALVVFLGSAVMLTNEAVVIPQQNATLSEELISIKQGEKDSQLTAEADKWDGYPTGIQDDLKTLYYLNSDIRGWLKYDACKINREVMYSSDGKFYLDHDFYKNHNKNGALFFDARNKIESASSKNKSLVIYGHNMASGQMFAKLNNLADSLDTMKSANTLITLDTLFSSAQYKIFAVLLQDSKANIDHYFSIQETAFANNTMFLNYVDGLRARSLYDFPDVDVKAEDEILILYTCTPKSIAHFDEARLAVVARRVRKGESTEVSSKNITYNKDVIMPYRWYTAQKKTPHSYYGTTKTTTTTKKGVTTTLKATTTKKGATTTTKKGVTTTKAVTTTVKVAATTVAPTTTKAATTTAAATTTTTTTTATTTATAADN